MFRHKYATIVSYLRSFHLIINSVSFCYIFSNLHVACFVRHCQTTTRLLSSVVYITTIEIMHHLSFRFLPSSFYTYSNVNGNNATRGTINIANIVVFCVNVYIPETQHIHANANVILAPVLCAYRIVVLVLSIPKSGCKNKPPTIPKPIHDITITKPNLP